MLDFGFCDKLGFFVQIRADQKQVRANHRPVPSIPVDNVRRSSRCGGGSTNRKLERQLNSQDEFEEKKSEVTPGGPPSTSASKFIENVKGGKQIGMAKYRDSLKKKGKALLEPKRKPLIEAKRKPSTKSKTKGFVKPNRKPLLEPKKKRRDGMFKRKRKKEVVNRKRKSFIEKVRGKKNLMYKKVATESFVSRSKTPGGSLERKNKRTLPTFVKKKGLSGKNEKNTGFRAPQRRRRNRSFEVKERQNEDSRIINLEKERLGDKYWDLPQFRSRWTFDYLVDDYSLHDAIVKENESHQKVDSEGRRLYQVDVNFRTWKFVCLEERNFCSRRVRGN